MVIPKVKVFDNTSALNLTNDINNFLSDKDVRQIIRLEHSCGRSEYNAIYSCLIMYIGLDDVRDIKIETVLDK